MHIRRGRISRKQGLEIVKKLDGIYPESYLGKPLASILNRIGLSVDEFDEICKRFTNMEIFEKDSKGELLKNGKNLIKINYDNEN